MPKSLTELRGSISPAAKLPSGTLQRCDLNAYYSSRSLPRNRVCPSQQEVHWQHAPQSAALVHAPECLQHQALPCLNTPNPKPGAMERWPAGGLAGQGPLPVDPTDGRSNKYGFSNRQQRWKLVAAEVSEAPELTLDEIRLFLTSHFGSLRKAFRHLDFFADDRLSVVEWTEGLHNLLTNSPLLNRIASVPRNLYNERMLKIFRMMDVDGDGLISYDELTRQYEQPKETTSEFKNRRKNEKEASTKQTTMIMQRTLTQALGGLVAKDTKHGNPAAEDEADQDEDEEEEARLALEAAQDPKEEEDSAFQEHLMSLARTACKNGKLKWSFLDSAKDAEERRSPVPSAQHMNVDADETLLLEPEGSPPKVEASQALRNFASVLLHSYKNLEDAFNAFDVSGNANLSMAEFVAGAKAMHFAGSARKVFRELDANASGTIDKDEFRLLRQLPARYDVDPQTLRTPTKRQTVAARIARSPILAPGPHRRGTCCASMDSFRPHGEHIASAAGFSSFARAPTSRLDALTHPGELIGMDPEHKSSEHGPGFCPKGPPYHAETGLAEHPIRGSGWKMGSSVNRVERFGPLVPSAQGKADRELSADSFGSYNGRAPRDNWQVHGSGASSFKDRSLRHGQTFGNATSCGLQQPTAIGPWKDSRLGLSTKSRSEPNLLRVSV